MHRAEIDFPGVSPQGMQRILIGDAISRQIFPRSIACDHVTQIYRWRISRFGIRFDEKEMLEISVDGARTATLRCVELVHAGRAHFSSLWGLANPRSRSQGDRRDKRSVYGPYVHRREGHRRSEAATLFPWGLGQQRTHDPDAKGGTVGDSSGFGCALFPAYVSPIWDYRVWLAEHRTGSDVAVHPHDNWLQIRGSSDPSAGKMSQTKNGSRRCSGFFLIDSNKSYQKYFAT